MSRARLVLIRDLACRIVNLLWLAGIAVYFLAALADPRMPRPPGGLGWLFWTSGPLAIIFTVAFSWAEWDEWRTRHYVRLRRALRR
jgi:hypothetical protein